MTIVPSQSFADISHRDTVERLLQCVQGPMHIVESVAPSGSSRLHSSMNFRTRNLYTTSLTVWNNITTKITSH